MKSILLVLFLLVSCSKSSYSVTKLFIQESEESIISAPISVSYKYGKVLFTDKTGKSVFLYSKSGELLKTFAPDLSFSDSIAVLREKPKDKRYVLIKDYFNDYPDESGKGSLENSLGNIYINCCFKDSETVTCGGIFGVLMKKSKYSAKEYGITTEAMMVEYNIKYGNIKSMPLPKPGEPYGVVKSQTMLYQAKKESYIMDFSTSLKSKNNSIPLFYALSKLSVEGKFQKAFFEVPEVLTAQYLSDDFIRVCFTGDDSLWCAYPQITKIYNPESSTAFDLILKDNTNNLFLDSVALINDVYDEKVENRIGHLMQYLRYDIVSISSYNEELLVNLVDRIDQKYILQVYDTKGKLQKETSYNRFNGNSEIYAIAYNTEDREFLFVGLENEKWYFMYKQASEVF